MKSNYYNKEKDNWSSLSSTLKDNENTHLSQLPPICAGTNSIFKKMLEGKGSMKKLRKKKINKR